MPIDLNEHLNRDTLDTDGLSPSDLQALQAEAASLDLDSDKGGNDYCVTCTKPGSDFGKRHTVRAGNGVFAFAKALRLCGSGFSISKGAC
jgi:hypothetical protein